VKQLLFILLAALLVLSPSIASAHDPGLSSTNLTVNADSIDAIVTLNQRDLESIEAKGEALAIKLLQLRLGDVSLHLASSRVTIDPKNNASFQLHFARRTGYGALRVSSGVIDELPFGHRQLITVCTTDRRTLGERLISTRENELTIEIGSALRSPPTSQGRFAEFFLLGVRHILTGYDHLLFLAGILIVCSSFGTAARVITCFTGAHSITLALATFNVLAISSRIVEPMIAASIVYVGVENLYSRGRLRWREVLTFTFGLVHGLGFASVLREIGIGTSNVGVALPLFSFNFGVEAGQLLVAASVLPIAWKLKSLERFPRIAVPALSSVIACAGAYWFFERIASVVI
jgi:hydrogenase/urease accessory protein HupE